MLAQRWNQRHSQVVLDMDMLYHTQERNDFCKEWTDRNGENGEHLYAKHQPLRWKLRNETIIGPKGPTGTDYLAYLTRENKGGMYKMTDRSLYGARAPFVKVYRKEEKLGKFKRSCAKGLFPYFSHVVNVQTTYTLLFLSF